MESVDGTFGIDPAWPISDEEGLKLEGYTFKVENNCPEAVNYIIGMDSLEVSGDIKYLNYDNIKISVDNNTPITFGGQDDIEHIEANDTRTIKDSKKLYTATVDGKVGNEPGKNEHNVKVWISSESLAEEQSRVFSGRMFITGGQKIENDSPLVQATSESCFEMDTETGTEIMGYDESCGDSVVIPATVKGNPVKTIDSNAFKTDALNDIYYDNDISNAGNAISPVDSVDVSSANVMFVFDNYEKNTGINLSVENIIGNATYIVKLTSDAPVNSTIDGVGAERNVADKILDSNNIPELTANQIGVYANLDATFSGPILGGKYIDTKKEVGIKGLDLSLASNIEKIEALAFTNLPSLASMSSSEQDDYNPEDYPVSLTTLNFGNNTNNIEIGAGAFSRIDVDELVVYTSYNGEQKDTASSDMTQMGYFTSSRIDKLTIKPTANDKIIKYLGNYSGLSGMFYGIYVNNLIIEEGITEVQKHVFNFFNENDGTSSLPSTLVTIGEYAFTGIPYKNITIPRNVNSIGDNAFWDSPTSSVETITFESGSCEGVTIGENAWASTVVVTPSTCNIY